MKDLGTFGKIYLATEPVDFRKQAHGLAMITEEALSLFSRSQRSIFIFTNKRKTAVKMLYWDATGYAMWWKTLEKDRFRWPKDDNSTMCIGVRDLKWLLEGVDFTKIKKHEKLNIM